MISVDQIRSIAMALPHVEEGPPVPAARRIAGFKVAGKSFLGVEAGGETITVSLAESDAKKFAAEHPEIYEEIWRNKKIVVGLRANLSKLSARRASDLIERSWRHTTTTHGSAR